MSRNIHAIPASEYDAAIATAQAYADGVRAGDADATMRAFHEDAVMFGLSDGKLQGGSARSLHAVITQFGAAPEVRTHMDVLAITPTTAFVRVEMEKDAIGADYTDFLTLMKQEGQWKVVAKIYHRHPA